jgi:7-cyano-7-deazaguanine synthase
MKNVVLLSGGMDSAVVLAIARKTGSVMSITFDYGQANRREIEVAKMLAEQYHVSHRVILIDSEYLRGSCALLGGENITNTFVPGRNLLFLAYGISMAEAIGADSVWFGANKDDAVYYPDCRQEFVDCMSVIAALGTKTGGIRVIAPLINMTKKEVYREGFLHTVPMQWTTTCARPQKDGSDCNECRGCQQRAEAMTGHGT